MMDRLRIELIQHPRRGSSALSKWYSLLLLLHTRRRRRRRRRRNSMLGLFLIWKWRGGGRGDYISNYTTVAASNWISIDNKTSDGWWTRSRPNRINNHVTIPLFFCYYSFVTDMVVIHFINDILICVSVLIYRWRLRTCGQPKTEKIGLVWIDWFELSPNSGSRVSKSLYVPRLCKWIVCKFLKFI